MNELAKLPLRWSTRRLHQPRLQFNRAPIRMWGKTRSDSLFISDKNKNYKFVWWNYCRHRKIICIFFLLDIKTQNCVTKILFLMMLVHNSCRATKYFSVRWKRLFCMQIIQKLRSACRRKFFPYFVHLIAHSSQRLSRISRFLFIRQRCIPSERVIRLSLRPAPLETRVRALMAAVIFSRYAGLKWIEESNA